MAHFLKKIINIFRCMLRFLQRPIDILHQNLSQDLCAESAPTSLRRNCAAPAQWAVRAPPLYAARSRLQQVANVLTMSPLQRTLAPNVCGASQLADASQMVGRLPRNAPASWYHGYKRRRLLTRQRARSAAHDFARWLAMQRAWRGVDDCSQACMAVDLA